MTISDFIIRYMIYGISLGATLHFSVWFSWRMLYWLSSALQGKNVD